MKAGKCTHYYFVVFRFIHLVFVYLLFIFRLSDNSTILEQGNVDKHIHGSYQYKLILILFFIVIIYHFDYFDYFVNMREMLQLPERVPDGVMLGAALIILPFLNEISLRDKIIITNLPVSFISFHSCYFIITILTIKSFLTQMNQLIQENIQ